MKDKFKKNKKKLKDDFQYKEHYKKNLSFFIILLFLIKIPHGSNSKNEYKFLINLNQIKISIKGPGTKSIIYSSFSYKPNTIVYDNSENTFNDSQLNLKYCFNQVILKFSSSITGCYYMFSGCDQITEIDLTEFDSSQVQSIDNMFSGCTSLKTIKFGNFKTSNVNSMLNAFENCEQLETLDLSSFDTSKVYDIHYMFSGCKSLKYLDLSNFRTSTCNCMHHLFLNCHSLISLDLSYFTINAATSTDMFIGCTNLEYVNLINANIINQIYQDIITNSAANIIFCVNESKKTLLNSLIGTNTQFSIISDCSTKCNKKKNLCCYYTCKDCDSFGNNKYHYCNQCKAEYNLEIEFNGLKNCYTKCTNLFYLDDNNFLTCVECSSCPNEYSKLILEKKQCIQNCGLDKEYIYEYKNNCYKECPNGTKESLEKNNICLELCTKESPFKLITIDKCVPYCPINDIIIDNCELNYKEKNENIEDKILFCIKEDLTKGYDLSQVDSGKDVLIDRNSTTYIITSTENQKKKLVE